MFYKTRLYLWYLGCEWAVSLSIKTNFHTRLSQGFLGISAAVFQRWGIVCLAATHTKGISSLWCSGALESKNKFINPNTGLITILCDIIFLIFRNPLTQKWSILRQCHQESKYVTVSLPPTQQSGSTFLLIWLSMGYHPNDGRLRFPTPQLFLVRIHLWR